MAGVVQRMIPTRPTKDRKNLELSQRILRPATPATLVKARFLPSARVTESLAISRYKDASSGRAEEQLEATNESESLPTMRHRFDRRHDAFAEVSGAVCLSKPKQRGIAGPSLGSLPPICGTNVENDAPVQDFVVAIEEADAEDVQWAQGRKVFKEKTDFSLPEMPILDLVSECGFRYRTLKERSARSRMDQSFSASPTSIPVFVDIGEVVGRQEAAL